MIRPPPRSTRTYTLFPSTTLCRSFVPWVAQAATVEGRERLRDSAQANRAREDFNRSVQALGAAAAASPFPDLLEETRAFSTQALGSLQAQPAAAGDRKSVV